MTEIALAEDTTKRQENSQLMNIITENENYSKRRARIKKRRELGSELGRSTGRRRRTIKKTKASANAKQ
jgi:hypothetical protein